MKLPIPFNNPKTYPGHSGVDFGQREGTPFLASDSGVVTALGSNRRGGFYIWVKYDSINPKVGYHHMPSHNGCPRQGERFEYAEQLGFVGNTGNSTGPHLHSEVSGYPSTEGYWKFFDKNRVVGQGSTASVINTEKEEEMTASFVNIKGVAGKRRGGCYAIMRDNSGKLFARFIDRKPLKTAPTVDTERAYGELSRSIPGLS